jgi:CheY-like chemotaxis protein
VLLVEDDPINREVALGLLEDVGLHVDVAHDGAEAVARAGQVRYDLVLMDVQMPVMDGYEATRRILELAPELPVVGQTAHALDEDRDRCLAAGMSDHIAKPIDAVVLVKLIRRVVAARRKAS